MIPVATVSDVFFIPELKNNLLSISQLQEKGLAILIQHGMLKIYHPEKGLIIQIDVSKSNVCDDSKTMAQ